MDRNHMMETLRRAHAHTGAAFVEIYQNCNVFNDGAFETITAKSVRDDMLIPLIHGEQIRFGEDGQKGLVVGSDGKLQIVTVADVGEDAILVHDETDTALGFMLSRLASSPTEPTPIGVFHAVDRPEYAAETDRQLALAQEQKGSGDLQALLHSGAIWSVD
jgi:2-oxoglutarate ferredoxin oxidoreductase subunit beta